MARLTPQQAQEKHAKRLKAATQEIADGVNGVTVAPGVQAAAKQEKMRTNLNAAIDSGHWANRVKSVSLEDWKAKMVQKGIPRISQGIDSAAPKTIEFFTQLLPFQDGIKQKLSSMPDLTLEDNLNRMVFQAREMSKFKRR